MLKTPDLRSDPRAARILAKSIYRELSSQGYDEKQIVALATELISEVTRQIASDQPQAIAR
ncbi:MAG: hypothetical protein H6709_14420 [Kofleriaceae bacterium]|nr:hypothetical protein [Myxococcales bacterium]MCB9560550.1 hypothetical protein [Kofleriaceae bacterium]MCB9573272.1 hypothetical protein [Kofleriaceae bacterium]